MGYIVGAVVGLCAGFVLGSIFMRSLCNRAFTKDLEDLNERLKGLVGDPKEVNAK